MEDKRRLKQYYKRLLHGGRGTFARAVDFAALRVILLLACYFWFSTLVSNTVLSWLLAAVTLCLLSVGAELYKSIRLDKLIAKERSRLAKAAVCQRLMLMELAEYAALIRSYVEAHRESYSGDCLIYPIRKSAPLDEDDIAAVCRAARAKGSREIAVFALSDLNEEAQAAIKRYFPVKEPSFEREKLISFMMSSESAPSEEELDDMILDKLDAEADRKKQLTKEPFRPSRMRRYLLTAAALLAISFFVDHALYYRLMAAACASFGMLAWWLGQTGSKRKAG